MLVSKTTYQAVKYFNKIKFASLLSIDHVGTTMQLKKIKFMQTKISTSINNGRHLSFFNENKHFDLPPYQ